MSKKLTDLLHIIMCSKLHTYEIVEVEERNADFCYYYIEDCIAGGENMEDHILWKTNLESFRILMRLKDDKEMERFLRDCLEISQKVMSLSEDNLDRLIFIKSLIKSGRRG